MGFDQSSVDEIDGEDISPSSVDTDSLDTGEVTIGDTGPVSSIVGDSGEYEILYAGFTVSSLSTSSTSFTEATSGPDRFRIPPVALTGYSKYLASSIATWDSADGEDLTMRLTETGNEVTGTETTLQDPSFDTIETNKAEISDHTSATRLEMEMKTSGGGSATAAGFTFLLWGELA